MAFPEADATQLLAECHRRCCVCHRFCGVKMELDHMVPRADGGPDTIDNAIAVCFECHAEIHLYNDRHPRGRKFRPEELRQHKEQWLAFCREHGAALAAIPPRTGVGPLQALIDELEFNQVVAAEDPASIGSVFQLSQFERCLSEGILSLVEPGVKAAIFRAYAVVRKANNWLVGMTQLAPEQEPGAQARNRAGRAIGEARPVIDEALAQLRRHLDHEVAEHG